MCPRSALASPGRHRPELHQNGIPHFLFYLAGGQLGRAVPGSRGTSPGEPAGAVGALRKAPPRSGPSDANPRGGKGVNPSCSSLTLSRRETVDLPVKKPNLALSRSRRSRRMGRVPRHLICYVLAAHDPVSTFSRPSGRRKALLDASRRPAVHRSGWTARPMRGASVSAGSVLCMDVGRLHVS